MHAGGGKTAFVDDVTAKCGVPTVVSPLVILFAIILVNFTEKDQNLEHFIYKVTLVY